MLPGHAKILIVDDEPDLLDVMRYFLTQSGFTGRILEAASGEASLALVEKERPDVVVSDIRMPGMSGLEVLQEMNARRIFTPVIFVSAFGDKRIVMEAWRLGAFDFLDKPISSQRLIENLQIALVLGERFNRERFEARRKVAS